MSSSNRDSIFLNILPPKAREVVEYFLAHTQECGITDIPPEGQVTASAMKQIFGRAEDDYRDIPLGAFQSLLSGGNDQACIQRKKIGQGFWGNHYVEIRDFRVAWEAMQDAGLVLPDLWDADTAGYELLSGPQKLTQTTAAQGILALYDWEASTVTFIDPDGSSHAASPEEMIELKEDYFTYLLGAVSGVAHLQGEPTQSADFLASYLSSRTSPKGGRIEARIVLK